MNRSAVPENKSIHAKWHNICIVFTCVFFITVFSLTTSADENKYNHNNIYEPLGEPAESFQIFTGKSSCKMADFVNSYEMVFYSEKAKLIYKVIFISLGAAYLFIGLGLLLNPAYYKQMLLELKTCKPAMYLGGAFAFLIGIVLLTLHFFWIKNIYVIITIIGWLALIKGIAIFVIPAQILKTLNIFIKLAKISTLRIMASFMIIFGIILALLGIFAT